MYAERIHNIRTQAVRCRELAETASDVEVAEELRRIAAEIEDAIAVLGKQRSEDVSDVVAL